MDVLESERAPDSSIGDILRFTATLDVRRWPQCRVIRLPLPDDKIVYPCPFCEDEEIYMFETRTPSYRGFQIRCSNCSSLGPFSKYYDLAIDFWNNRV